MKKGKPMDDEITERVKIAVEENNTITVEGIKSWITEHYKQEYSWNTIRSHLDILIKREELKEVIVSEKGRKVSVITLNV